MQPDLDVFHAKLWDVSPKLEDGRNLLRGWPAALAGLSTDRKK